VSHVLLLNASYEPLNVCSWKRAVVLLMKGKAVAVERQQEDVLPHRFPRPVVIRLLHYVKIPHKEIPLTRRNVMHRDNYTCQYCGRKADLTIDHILPRSRGGKDTWENVTVACLKCNIKKGDRTPAEAGYTLHQKPTRPFNFVQFELSKQRRVDSHHYDTWRKYLFVD
jgi:5-methylcytosine-specific restriction endonuclease McrA